MVAGTKLASVSAGALQNAKTQIEKNRLAGVETTVVPAVPKALDFGLAIAPDTPDLRAAVKNSLETYITERQYPAAQIALLKLDKYLETKVKGLKSAAIQAPTKDIVSTQREILRLGQVKWG